jgi:hypothetical protein
LRMLRRASESRASLMSGGGRMPGMRLANRVFPVPGGP